MPDSTILLVEVGSTAHGTGLPGGEDHDEMDVLSDIVPPNDPDGTWADVIDGSIGEASMFHEAFGYYSQGVSEETAVLPEGWRERLVRYESPATNGVVAWCLELHDLWISKAIANREKDQQFCRALLATGRVAPVILEERLSAVTNLAEDGRALVELAIRTWGS